MATIALYKSQANQMDELITDTMISVGNYITELSSLKSKALCVNTSVCDLDDVTDSIQSSTETQQMKYSSLGTFFLNNDTFIANVESIDDDVAELVNQNKDDFYDKYDYLKPEYEKDLAVKAGEILASALEWCAENWESVVNLIVATVIVVVIATWCVVTFGAVAVIVAALLDISILDIIIKLKEDLDNFDWNNQDPSKVKNANFFSMYRGVPVLYMPKEIVDSAFSLGIIVVGEGNKLETNSYFKDMLDHEYGHTLQLKEYKLIPYIFNFALPSRNNYLLDKEGLLPYPSYYDAPWEFDADVRGGVVRTTDPLAEVWRDLYFDASNKQKKYYQENPDILFKDAKYPFNEYYQRYTIQENRT